MDYHMIYLRRKLLRAAKEMRKGLEPKEPWLPASYRYHAASAPIVNGDVDAAVARAKQQAKVSLIPAGPIAAPVRSSR